MSNEDSDRRSLRTVQRVPSEQLVGEYELPPPANRQESRQSKVRLPVLVA